MWCCTSYAMLWFTAFSSGCLLPTIAGSSSGTSLPLPRPLNLTVRSRRSSPSSSYRRAGSQQWWSPDEGVQVIPLQSWGRCVCVAKFGYKSRVGWAVESMVKSVVKSRLASLDQWAIQLSSMSGRGDTTSKASKFTAVVWCSASSTVHQSVWFSSPASGVLLLSIRRSSLPWLLLDSAMWTRLRKPWICPTGWALRGKACGG